MKNFTTDWTDAPFIAIGNDELETMPLLKETILCDKCGKRHKVEYGNKVHKDGTTEKSALLAFYKCGKKTFLAGIDGKEFSPKPKEYHAEAKLEQFKEELKDVDADLRKMYPFQAIITKENGFDLPIGRLFFCARRNKDFNVFPIILLSFKNGCHSYQMQEDEVKLFEVNKL